MKMPFKYLALAAFLPYSLSGAFSQDTIAPFEKGESITLFTDRSVYIAGETILFTVRLHSGMNDNAQGPDRVYYSELISPAGQQVSGGKFRLEMLSGPGCLDIPGDLVSGIYYLRAYTRTMRNRGPSSYAYEPLIIFNPAIPESLPGDPLAVAIFRDAGDELQTANPMAPAILADQGEYSPRDSVKIHFQSAGPSPEVAGGWCLAVIPEGSRKTSANIHPSSATPKETGQYQPEHRGISISGRLSEPAVINLSIPAEKEMMAIRSSDDGRFCFSLPGYEGARDLFLCPVAGQNGKVTVLVDNDFCPEPLTLPSPEFNPDAEERRLALRMARNLAVSKHFGTETCNVGNTTPQPARPFYDVPTEVLLMDRFVMLPTLEEYFSELLTPVKVRKKHGASYFKFMGSQAGLNIYDPLVMIDWVAVDDVGEILRLSPEAILRIEFYNAPYVKGDMIYGGIMNFISRQKDFAGIDLPASGIFVNYRFYHECHCHFPAGAVPAAMPDARNTVYWDPALQEKDGQIPPVTITAPDSPGNYQVLLRGVGIDGQTLERKGSFSVVPK